jgi:hypothetical protein
LASGLPQRINEATGFLALCKKFSGPIGCIAIKVCNAVYSATARMNCA